MASDMWIYTDQYGTYQYRSLIKVTNNNTLATVTIINDNSIPTLSVSITASNGVIVTLIGNIK